MTTTNAAPVPLGRIMIRDARLAFANGLFEATAMEEGQDRKYNCGLILRADHPQLKEIEAKQIAVATEKWAAKAPAFLEELRLKDRLALHNGNLKPNYDGYPGNFFLSPSAAETAQPKLMGFNPHETLTEKQLRAILYSGCYVNASVDIWAQDNKWGRRINAQIRGVQKLRDGDAFSAGRPADASEFEPVTEGAEAADIA